MTNKQKEKITKRFEDFDDQDFKKMLIDDMIKILSDTKISDYSKEHILDMYCWVLTERKKPFDANNPKTKNAKFKGCEYWSEKALDNINNTNELRHEHVVPRSVLRDYINKWRKQETQTIDSDKINKYFIGCVVTKDEAKWLDEKFKDKMPNDLTFDGIEDDNLWSRYKEVFKSNTDSQKISSACYKVEWTPKNRGWDGGNKSEKI